MAESGGRPEETPWGQSRGIRGIISGETDILCGFLSFFMARREGEQGGDLPLFCVKMEKRNRGNGIFFVDFKQNKWYTVSYEGVTFFKGSVGADCAPMPWKTHTQDDKRR